MYKLNKNWHKLPLAGPLEWGGLLGIIVLNFVLKILFVGVNDIALDEPFTLFVSHFSLDELWELFKSENNPPLHFWVSHFWNRAFGLDPVVVRLPYLLFSCLTAGMIFRVGNRHISGWAGILAALLFTLSTEHIFYAHEARTYALFTFLSVLALAAFLKMLENPVSIPAMLALAVANALLIYCHFLGVFLIAGQGIAWLWFTGARWRPLLRYAASGMISLVLLAPVIYLLYLRMQEVSTAGTWVEPPRADALLRNIAMMLNGAIVTALLVGCVLAGVLVTRKKVWVIAQSESARPWRATMTIFFVAYMAMFVVSFLFTPVFLPRYVIFLSPMVYLALGAALVWAWQERIGMAAIVVLAIMGASVNLNPSNNWEVAALVDFVEDAKTAQTPVVICPNTFDITYLYHQNRELFAKGKEAYEQFYQQGYFAVSNKAAIMPLIDQKWEKFIYLDAKASLLYPENGILELLKNTYGEPEMTHFPEIFDVYIWNLSPQATPKK